MVENRDRRTRRRKAINSRAWADPGGILPVIDCRIVDFTEDGARVVAPPGVEMPAIFQLQIDSSRILGAAEVIWREHNHVGVRFLTRL